MNVFMRDIRFGIKSFLLWTIALFVFVFVGAMKFTGVEAGGAAMMAAMLEAIPRIVLAVMGFSSADITSFSGFYGLLEVYVMIIVAIYAVHLGGSAVCREQIDKTYEFLFTKPRSRMSILGAKLGAGVVFLAVFSLLNGLFSQAAYATLNLSDSMGITFAFFSLVQFVVGLVFFALGALFGAVAPSSEIGSRMGNASVLVLYLIGVVYASLDNVEFLRVFTPFKYFDPTLLADHQLDLPFLALSLAIAAVSIAVAIGRFRKRDLVAA